MRSAEADKYCIVAVDAAKYMKTAMICTIFGDILNGPFEFDGSQQGFKCGRGRLIRRGKLTN